MKLKKIAVFTVLISMAAAAFAQSDTEKRFALVIGNQAYKESPLSNPVADANLVAERLKECGFDVTLKKDLALNEMSNEIADYASKIEASGPNTISFFYYSGHGVQIDGKNYMVPVDDEKIDTTARAKTRCIAIDQVIELVNSKTQVIVLDACRNNPFKQTKQTFTKGLTSIATPKKVTNFLTLFSTQAGQTADDGSGRNSLFTERLAEKMRAMNVDINTVFNDVADDVKNKTGGRQTPLVSGTSVKFELMNSKIAEARIKELKAQAKALETNPAAKNTKEYATEKNLLEAELKLMQEKKAAAEEDAKIKAEKAKKDAALMNKNKKEMERVQKEAAAQKKALQQQKAKQKSSLTFIDEIEANKERIQKIRQDAADKIYTANSQAQKEADEKIAEIRNAPLGMTEKDAKGNITSKAKKAREEQVKLIQADANKEKAKNFDRYYDAIKTEETERLKTLGDDLKTLSTATYTASSLVTGKDSEIEYRVSDYDGAGNKWSVNLSSNLFEKSYLINTSLDLTYEILCKKIIGKKYIAPEAMTTSAELDQYEEDITVYHSLFTGSDSPLLTEVDYKMAAVNGKASVYKITTTTARIKSLIGEKEELLTEKPYSNSNTITWKSVNELKTVQQIVAEYEKEDAKRAAAAEKAEKQRKKESEKTSYRPSYSSSNTEINWEEVLGDPQKTIDGFQFTINYAPGLGAGFNTAYFIPFMEHFFAGPYLGVQKAEESVYSEVEGKSSNETGTLFRTGCAAGASWSFNAGSGVLNPFARTSLGFATGDSVYGDFGIHLGAAYLINDKYGFTGDLGFNTASSSNFNINIGAFVTGDFVKELWDSIQ